MGVVAVPHCKPVDSSHQSAIATESFSVYEEPSVSSFMGQNTSRKRAKEVVKSFSVYNDSSGRMQEGIDHGKFQGERSRVDLSQRALDSFSVFEEPSITNDHVPWPSKADQRNPLGLLRQDDGTTQSFSVFEEPSVSDSLHLVRRDDSRSRMLLTSKGRSACEDVMGDHTAESFNVFVDKSTSNSLMQQEGAVGRKPLAFIEPESNHSKNKHPQSTVESFSVFEDPSIAEPSRNGRSAATESFSVFEDPSQRSINVVATRNNKDVMSNPSHENLSSQVIPSSFVDRPNNEGATSPLPIALEQQDMPGFTEFDIPSFDRYEPTSTPTGKRMGEFDYLVQNIINCTVTVLNTNNNYVYVNFYTCHCYNSYFTIIVLKVLI